MKSTPAQLKAQYVYRAKKRNSPKIRARYIVKQAIRRGDIAVKPCEECGNQRSQAHHRDYDKPLEVVFLCDKHHKQEHKRLKDAGIAVKATIPAVPHVDLRKQAYMKRQDALAKRKAIPEYMKQESRKTVNPNWREELKARLKQEWSEMRVLSPLERSVLRKKRHIENKLNRIS